MLDPELPPGDLERIRIIKEIKIQVKITQIEASKVDDTSKFQLVVQSSTRTTRNVLTGTVVYPVTYYSMCRTSRYYLHRLAVTDTSMIYRHQLLGNTISSHARDKPFYTPQLSL